MIKLKFWEDQLPNGQVTQSSSRLIFLSGWLFLYALITFEVLSVTFWNGKMDYALIAMIAGFATGQKMYQKAVESKDISPDTPIVPEVPVTKTDAA